MFDRVNNDIKEAMKGKNKDRLEALRMLKAQLIENKTSKSPRPELDVVIAYCKKLSDSIESYPAESPQRDKIKNEMAQLQDYLPQQLNEQEVKDIIQNIITQLNAAGVGANMGQVMKELTPQIKGRYDGKMANQMVKDAVESK